MSKKLPIGAGLHRAKRNRHRLPGGGQDKHRAGSSQQRCSATQPTLAQRFFGEPKAIEINRQIGRAS